MPFGQFNETRAWNAQALFDSTYVLGTSKAIGAAPSDVTLRLDVLRARNSDAVAHILRTASENANFTLADVVVPAGAGYVGNPDVDVLSAWGLDTGQRFILLYQADQLNFQLLSVPSATTFVNLTAFGGTFPANL